MVAKKQRELRDMYLDSQCKNVTEIVFLLKTSFWLLVRTCLGNEDVTGVDAVYLVAKVLLSVYTLK